MPLQLQHLELAFELSKTLGRWCPEATPSGLSSRPPERPLAAVATTHAPPPLPPGRLPPYLAATASAACASFKQAFASLREGAPHVCRSVQFESCVISSGHALGHARSWPSSGWSGILVGLRGIRNCSWSVSSRAVNARETHVIISEWLRSSGGKPQCRVNVPYGRMRQSVPFVCILSSCCGR